MEEAPAPERAGWILPAVVFGSVVLVVLAIVGVVALVSDDDGGTEVADDEPEPPEIDPELEGATWTLVTGDGPAGPVRPPDGWPITISFEGGTFGGTASCNGYGGGFTLEGEGSIALTEVGATAMACEPPETMEAEAAFLAAIGDIDSYAVDGEILRLSGDASELVFERLAPVPIAELVGQLWLLDTLIQGETAGSVSGDPATLLLRSDGTLEGGTGCRSLSGTWVEAGGQIVFTDFAAEGDSCTPDLVDQDGFVVTVLGDGFVPVVEGDRLTVTSVGDEGLSYQAIDDVPGATVYTVEELLELRPVGVVSLAGEPITYGRTTILCDAEGPDPDDPTRCPGRWVVVTNHIEQLDGRGPFDGLLREDGRFQIVGPGSGVEQRGSGVERTDADAAVLEPLLSTPVDLGALLWVEEVELWLGNQIVETRTPDQMQDPAGWVFAVDDFEGFAGPFDILALLQSVEDTLVLIGPHDHCAGQPLDLPDSVVDLRQLSIQPNGIDSCIQWFAVDVFVDDQGRIEAIMLDLFGP